MSVNFTPEQKEYKDYRTFGTFRMFVLENFPFIAEDFDALTYYQMLCKIVEYLKDVIDNNKALQENQIGLLNAFNELQSYVNNYFDNLDVQEEINNKLDTMTENGTLQEIISYYLKSTAVFGFDNVEKLKQAPNLINGSYARTYGFYEINDGGDALYKIRNIDASDVVDNMKLIAISDNLVAELIVTSDFVNIKKLGFNENDTEENITNKINEILQLPHNFIFRNLNFNINNSLDIKSNTKIRFENCNIKNINTANRIYILNISDVENVEITGLNTSLSFNKPETTQQACIRINNSKNIYVDGFTCSSAGGDGVFLNGKENKQTENVTVKNCIIDNSRRNGISVVGGVYKCIIDNCKITNTIGTLPEYGIDLEPWQDGVINDTIIVRNCYFAQNNGGGLDMLFGNKNILIENNIFDNNGLMSRLKVANGEENYVKNCTIRNNEFKNTTLYLRGTQYAEYSILNNKFDKSKISTDTEPDFVSFVDDIPRSGFVNIIGNVINDTPGNAINLGGVCNANVKNNMINNCEKMALNIVQSNTINFEDNIIRNYQMDLNSNETENAILLKTSSNITMINNKIFKDENLSLNLTNLINIASTIRKSRFIGNKATKGNYTNMFYVGVTDDNVILQNNESKTLYNDTTKYLPLASEKYAGMVYNQYNTDHYVPRICLYEDGTYKWKTIIHT